MSLKLITTNGKIIHLCSVCDNCGVWDENWSWYGSYRDLEDGRKITKCCSAACREKFVKNK